MDKKGLVHIYWGNGKGKTSAALGVALRASGYNYKIHLVQFLKNSPAPSGELIALKKLENFSCKSFGTGDWCLSNSKMHKQEVEEAIQHIYSCFEKDYDLIIADEILYALQLNLIGEESLKNLIKSKPEKTELILTGSHISFPEIFSLADYVTEIKSHKHPFDSGIKSRKGIEY